MLIRVEVRNEIMGDGIFGEWESDAIDGIPNIVAKMLAEKVVVDGRTRQSGMWLVYEIPRLNFEARHGVWKVTDADTDQRVRWMGGRRYEVIEAGVLHEIDLDDFSETELLNYLCAFSDTTLEEYRQEHGDNTDWLLAEMIAELETP